MSASPSNCRPVGSQNRHVFPIEICKGCYLSMAFLWGVVRQTCLSLESVGHSIQTVTVAGPLQSHDKVTSTPRREIVLEHVKFHLRNELVGGFNHLEKYDFVNGKDDIPYMKWKIIHSCSKPPTSYMYNIYIYGKSPFCSWVNQLFLWPFPIAT